MSTVQILDNFLPQQEFEHLRDILMGGDFPWYFSKTKVSTHDPENLDNFQFTHMIYDNYNPKSQLWGQLDPIVRRLNAQAWLRTKVNLTPKTVEQYVYGMHVDIDDFVGITGVYYVNDNNGKTMFESGQVIDTKANRLVLFNSQLMHSGTSCTDQKARCVINFNFLPNPAMNLSEEDRKRIVVVEMKNG